MNQRAPWRAYGSDSCGGKWSNRVQACGKLLLDRTEDGRALRQGREQEAAGGSSHGKTERRGNIYSRTFA